MYTKAVLGQKNKNELLHICQDNNIEVTDSRMINNDIIDLILLSQEDEEVVSKEKTNAETDMNDALERVLKLEQMYKQQLAEMGNSSIGYKPQTVLSKKLSKKEIAYREAQLVVKSRKGKTYGQLKKMLEKELLSLHRVIVTEVANKQFAHDAEYPNRLVAWGNSIIGYKHSPVPFNVEYVLPLGVIKNLKAATIRNMRTEEGNNNLLIGSPINRFKVDVLPNFTEDEIVEMKEKQMLTKAAGYEQ